MLIEEWDNDKGEWRVVARYDEDKEDRWTPWVEGDVLKVDYAGIK